MSEGALAGITVLEIASYVSGPYAGMLLSDLGASVIKIEPPDGGDPFRQWGKVEYSATFGSLNRNKQSVTLDLRADADRETVRRLAKTVDVLIENHRPGAMERMGLGYDRLRALNGGRLIALLDQRLRLRWSLSGISRLRHDRPGHERALEPAH